MNITRNRQYSCFFIATIVLMIPIITLSGCNKKPASTTNQTAGISTTASTTPPKPAMLLTSSAFDNNAAIPAKYTQTGANVSPTLSWMNLPPGTKSLAITVDDLDAKPYVHWEIFNIPPTEKGLAEGIPTIDTLPNGALQGVNGTTTIDYIGPFPPPGTPHHYRFRLYALDTMISLSGGATKAQLLEKMTGHTIDNETAELIGIFEQ